MSSKQWFAAPWSFGSDTGAPAGRCAGSGYLAMTVEEREDDAMRREAVRTLMRVLEGWNRFAETCEIDRAFWPARPLQLELFG